MHGHIDGRFDLHQNFTSHFAGEKRQDPGQSMHRKHTKSTPITTLLGSEVSLQEQGCHGRTGSGFDLSNLAQLSYFAKLNPSRRNHLDYAARLQLANCAADGFKS